MSSSWGWVYVYTEAAWAWRPEVRKALENVAWAQPLLVLKDDRLGAVLCEVRAVKRAVALAQDPRI
jgi:hypothetical protein